MSLADTTRRADAVGNGSVTDVPFSFKIYAKADLQVLVDGSPKALDTDYSVKEPGGSPFESLPTSSLPSTGFVQFTVAPANQAKVAILGAQPFAQGSVYVPNEDFPAKRLEKDLDKLAIIAQQLREVDGRAFKFKKQSLLKDKEWPDPSGVVQLLAFDGALNPVLITLSSAGITGVANPMDGVGQLIIGGTAGAPAKLAAGAAGALLHMLAGSPAWLTVGANGGLLQVASGLPAWLAIGAANRVLRSNGSVPSWSQVLAPDFRRFEGSAENAGAVTVTANTSVVSLDLGTVVLGDRIFVSATGEFVKGAVDGHTFVFVRKLSGTGVIQWINDRISLETNQRLIATDSFVPVLTGIAKVTTGGTLVLHIEATSLGSNSTVTAGTGQLYAWVIPGT